MKLHLPTRLRAAVLACFAVVTSFTTTLCTGVLAGGAFVITAATLVVPHAEAANYTWTNTGTSESCMSAGPWTAENGTVLNSWNSGDNQVSPMISSGTNTLVFIADTDTETYNKQLKYTFDNLNIAGITVSEDATGYVVRADVGNRQFVFNSGTYTFHEDFTWKTADADSNGTMHMRGTQTWNIDDGNTVTLNSGSHAFNFQPEHSAAITQNGGTVQLEGSGVINGSGSYTVASGVLNLGGRTVSGGSFTTIGGTIKNGTFAAGGKLAVGASPVNVGDITFNGGMLDLSGATLGSTALLNTSGTVSFGNASKIELGDVTALSVDTEYTVLSAEADGWIALTVANFTQGGYTIPRSEVEMTSTGFKFTSIGTNYTDMTPTGNFTWNYTDEVWNTEQDSSDAPIAFAAGDSAVFSANADLTLTETEIAAAAVTVNQGAELTLTGNGNRLNCANVVLAGDLVLKDNVLASSSRVSGAGTITIDGNVQFDSIDTLGEYTGNIVINNLATLKANAASGGNSCFGVPYLNNKDRYITVNQGGTLDTNGQEDVYYAVVLNGGTLANKASSGYNSDYKQLPKITLENDSEVCANAQLGMRLGTNDSGAPTLTLNGHRLTKTGSATFFLYNTSVTAGTIDIQAGTLNIAGGGSSTNTQFLVGNAATLTITSGTHNGATISAGNGSTLRISGGTFSNAIIAVRSGNTASSTNASLGATVTVGDGSTFEAKGGTYTDTAIVLEDGATFNYRTAGNHTFKSFNTGASTLSAADDSSRTMTVTEASTSTGLLTKKNRGHLVYNGAADLQGGLNITEGSVRFNSNASIGGPVTMNDGTALHVGGEADVVISGTGHSIKGLNILAGAETTFESGSSATLTNTTLAAPITNKGNLTLAGTLSADLTHFSFTPKNPGEKPTYVDASGYSAVSGYLSGERVYTLIENTGTLNDTAITSVSAAVEGNYENGKLTVSAVDDTVFYVNVNPSTGKADEVKAVNLGAGKKYYMNGGHLTIDSSVIDDSAEGDEVAGILLGTVGDEGRMVLTVATTLGNNSTTLAGCELEVSGVQLTLGEAQENNIDLSSFDKVVLNDGGKIQYQATGNSTFNNLTVESGVGEFYSRDTDTGIIQFDGVTTVGEYTVTEDGVETRLPATLKFAANWNTGMLVKQLSGAGNVEVYSGDNGKEDDTFNLTIDSLSGFTGKLSFTKDTEAPFDALTVNTGTAAVSMKGISAASTGGNHAALALILNVQGNTTLSEGLLLSNTEDGNGVTVTANIGTGASLTSDLVVTGTDNTFNLDGGNLSGDIRLNDNAALSTALTATGNLVVGNNATLNVAAAQTVTVAGVTELGETSALTKEGAGELNMGTSATLDSLSITGGTVRFQSGTIGNLMVTGGVAHITGATSTVGSDGTFSSSHNNGFYIKGTGEVNIGDGTNQCVVTATRVEMGDNQTGSGADSGGTLNVKSGSRLIVESPDVINHDADSQDTYHKTGFILGEWDVSSTVNVEGVLLLKEASVTCGNNTGYVNVKNGGVLAAKGFLNAKDNNGTLVLAMEDGGKLILGDAGITAKTITATLGAGTVGIMTDSLISKNVTLGSTAGTTFNTAKYVWASDGANISEGTEGGTLTVSGVLSGSGKLVKTGDGTLKLTATNTYGGGTNLTGGTLEIAAESALGSGALSITGGILDVTGNVTLGSTVSTTVSGGSLKASHADGWILTSASVGGAAVSADSAGKVTMTNTTVTGNITGNDKLVLAGTVNATANATVSGASVGDITVTTTDANKLTLNNTTIGSTITNNGALEFSGTQNVTLAGSSATKYADVYGSTTYGDNGYKSTVDVYTLVSGTAASAASDTIWQVNGVALSGKPIFADNVLTHITGDAAGKVYYINRGTVVYETGADCTEAEKLQLTGGKLVMSKELDSTVPTDSITVTGSSTTLELKTELAANKLSMGTGAATVLMGDGTLNMGTGTALASGISLGTETDAKWAGTVKVTGATLSDANLGALGVTGSSIELDDTDGTLKGGTYAADVLLSNGSELTLGAGNAFNGGLDATAGTLSIAGKNSISTLTLADGADLGINLVGMGMSSLKDIGTDAILTVGKLNAAGGTVNLKALVGDALLLTMSDGQSIRLVDITTCNATLGLLIGSSTSNVLEVEDANGFTYTYTLEENSATGHTIVTVSAKLAAAGWVGDAKDTWKSTDAVGGTDANWAGKIGGFYGFGSGTVNLDTNGVTAGDVIVSATGGTTVYTFEGGALSAVTLAVNAGSLKLNNVAVTTTSTQVSDSAVLTVNAGKKLMVGTDMAVLDTAKLNNNGSIEVTGTLSVDKTTAVTNTGTLKTGSINASGATIANSGSLITGGGTIGKLTGEGTLNNSGALAIESKETTTLGVLTNSGTLNMGGDLTVKTAVTSGGTVNAANVTVNGDAAFTSLTTGKLKASSLTVKDAAITTLDTDKLTVGGGTVAVTNDVTLAELSGSGTLNAAGKVSLTSSVDTKVNVKTSKMEPATYGSSLGSLSTDFITMPEGSKLSTESALLTVDSVGVLSAAAIGIDVSESAFAALDKLEDGRYAAGNYLLIDGADSAAMFTYVNGQHLDTIIATGMNAGLAVNNGVLSLSISEITNENGEVVGMVWDTTNGNTMTNNGVGIDTDAGFYKTLDYVKQVLVTEDVTFDLSADSVGDSVAGNTSDPVSGLLIRNLSGSGELTIKGNTAAQDVATLMNTPGREISAVGLTADAATVNLGLPKGAEGYLLSDLSSTGPTLKSLNLVNRSVVNVNSNTEVLGDTDVADYSRLSVKEGNTLTTGMLSGTDEAEISGVIRVTKGGVYTGTYDEATLVADSGSNLHLRTGARRSMSLQVNADGQVTLDSAGQDGSMDNLRVGESLMARAMGIGSAKLNLLNTAVTDDGISHSTITLTEDEGNYINKSEVTLSLGAAETARTLSSPGSPMVIDGMVDVLNSSITVNMLGNSVKNGALEVNTESDKDLTLARFVTGGHVEGNTVTLTGTPEMKALLEKYYTNARLDSKGNIKVDRVTDYYGSRMQLSDNARVGIDMADAALVKLNPQVNRGSYKDLADVLDTLDTAVATGNRQTADELGAAVSGASVAALGAAVAGDVERQLMGIRNRTTTMGVDQTQVNENMPYFNAWINAEGDFRRMDEDGTAAGYELSSWGGTVGFDVDMTPRLTMGLAATAMYGDFTAKSADHAEGDLDTYYVTAFARYAANRWSHTFVATAGMADTSLKRTVSHAGGSYSTEGDAEAVSFGFLYELGYVVAMNESATACLQPVFNVMLTHSSLDGYTEEGSDAALRMGGVDMTTVTFGMGARAQAIVGTNLYNRSSMVEGRALLKVRTGDTEAEAENALGAVPGAMGSVKAAELGTIGAELGVGITVPMGSDGGSIFADASLEVGSGYTNINGTVGYRINF